MCGPPARTRCLARGRNDGGVDSGERGRQTRKEDRRQQPRRLPGATADYLTYWLGSVAIHRLRESTHTRNAASVRLHLIPGLGTRKIARLTAKDVGTFLDRLRTACQCCAQGLDTEWKSAAQLANAAGSDCPPRPVTYVQPVLNLALEQAVCVLSTWVRTLSRFRASEDEAGSHVGESAHRFAGR
ncbi:hypothetical protein ACFTWS_29280 [Streptomyces sp. NPDC057027]|uniref:hypothetical protein n=1 Tax=Streptomyces sp. NPDC057027 TaxID=3346004 RepID=UPI003644E589